MYDALTAAAQRVLKEQFQSASQTIEWRCPQDQEHGDLTTASALRIAKEAGKNPRDIADALVAALKDEEGVERVEVAGAGHVNIWFTPQALIAQLKTARKACSAKVTRTEELPVIVDYSGPNIAKPLGIHHILSTVIGQAVVNLYRHEGWNVIGWSYPGDWGTQFGKLAVAFEKWGDGKPISEYTIDELLALYVRFHQESEQNAALEDEARAAFSKLEGGDQTLRAFWKEVVRISRSSLEKTYDRLHVSLDVETGESFYEDKMEPIFKEGIRKKVIVEGEGGALIVAFPEESDMPPCLIRKGDGSTLYATRDLAMIRYRIDEYHPRSVYYVVDVAQKLHFEQLFAVCEKLGWDLPELEHTLFGRMRFKDKAMSTRKGTILKLDEALDEAVRRADEVIRKHEAEIQTDDRGELAEMMGVGALVYGILSQNRKMDIVFDWDRMLSFDGNSAPYLQYTHARAKSVLRKADIEDAEIPADVKELTEKERSLINMLLLFSQVLSEACASRMPHLLTNYLFKLCQEYNAFYNDEPILKAEGPVRALRLALTSITASVLSTGAELLTIRVPDRM